MTLPPLNMLSDEFRADPYPYYREYRAQDPVHRGVPLQPGRAAPWFLFRYRDIVPLLRDQRAGRGGLVANREQVEPELGRFRSMLHMDPPDHTRLRNLVSKAFTPRHIALQRERIVSLANEVLDEALEQDSIDVIADLAYPLPVSVIGAMLGVPTDERQLYARGRGRSRPTSTRPTIRPLLRRGVLPLKNLRVTWRRRWPITGAGRARICWAPCLRPGIRRIV